MWNWRDSLENSFMGTNWIDNIHDKNDLEIAKKISNLKKQPCQVPHLLDQFFYEV